MIYDHPDYFVKLDLEIAVDQQTRARDRTFEGVPDSGCRPVPAGQPRPYLVNLWPILPNDLNMLKSMIWGALLVATSLLNTCKKIGWVMNKILYAHIWAYAPNMINFGP